MKLVRLKMSNFEHLPLETLVEVASKNHNAWGKLLLVSKNFLLWARTDGGKKYALKQFCIKKENFTMIWRDGMLVLHSFFGEPAYKTEHTSVWYHGGLPHRGKDLPAAEQYSKLAFAHYPQIMVWCKRGVVHRENGRSAIQTSRGSPIDACVENGYLHAEDTHAVRYMAEGTGEWHFKGEEFVRSTECGDRAIDTVLSEEASLFLRRREAETGDKWCCLGRKPPLVHLASHGRGIWHEVVCFDIGDRCIRFRPGD